MLKIIPNLVMKLISNYAPQWLHSFLGLEANMRILNRNIVVLTKRAVDIRKSTRVEKLPSGNKRKREVEDWLKEVDNKKRQVQVLENDYQQGIFRSRILLSQRVGAMIRETSDLREQGSFPSALMLDVQEINSEPLVTEELIGQSAQQNLRDTWALLIDDDHISCIGIYGMAGVGKTAVAIHIHNNLLRENKFLGHVYWISVSSSDVSKLQDDLARALHLNLKYVNVDDHRKKAAKLSRALERKKKFVILLDGVSTPIDVKKIGIPLGEGKKLIVTSRSLDVCLQMGCQKEVKVVPLSREEGWKLFTEKLGSSDLELPPNVLGIARSISERCGGLPLGIATKATRLIRVNDIREWRDALAEMEEHSVKPDDVVFEILKCSFNGLKNEMYKTCFLHCSTHLKDEDITRDEVIRRLISEGLVDRRNSKAQIDQGLTILKALEKDCLLESVVNDGVDCVKMHHLIRDMAIKIMKTDPKYTVLKSKSLVCLCHPHIQLPI
ncbi:hypothetical protein ACH5RR_013828 [Cinchona calisaya]|uniref:AAA+ ATPase domain-containing protein n=1 Tax=Cinchona calisaya TaxID=153742 RepID=A0ABD3A152_9GENT